MSITCKHGIPGGCPECKIQHLETNLSEKQQDLNDARNGWESANEQLNEVCKQRDELLSVMQFILRGMDDGYIKCAPYFDFDPDAENIEFKHPADMIRTAITKSAA